MILPSFGLRPQTKNCEMTKDLNDNNRMKLLIEASALVVFVIISITSVLLVLKLTQKSDTEIGETVDSRNVAKDGAWCWFGDPRAVYFDGTSCYLHGTD